MKKFLLFFVLLSTLLLTSCAEDKVIDGHKYEAYGLFNPEVRVDSIQYKVSPGSVICGILFVETVVAPVYIFGWKLYEPVKVVHCNN